MNHKNNFPEDPRITSGSNMSFWNDHITTVSLNPLQRDMETDVVIIGGGISGLSIAYCLTQSGRNVVLVEDGFLGSGETGRTTAHFVTALDDRYYNLIKSFGEVDTRLIANSHMSAIDFVEKVVKEENIDCGFERVNGYLFLHPSDDKKSLQKEYEAALKAGLEVKLLSEAPGIICSGKCIQFSNQAQLHPLKYINGLAQAIEMKGGKIFTGTHASKIDATGIETEHGLKVKANHVVVATNTPVSNYFNMFLKIYAYRTYVLGAYVRKNSLPNALWWDTGNFDDNRQLPPYHYVRLHPFNDKFDLLICGGEDHLTGQVNESEKPENKRFDILEEWMREYFKVEEIVYRWSGQVSEPMDGVAYIGRNPRSKDNIYIVTGDSGNGMTHGTIAGMLITDLINGKENKWEKIYSPSRINLLRSGPMFKQMWRDLLSYLKQMPNFKGAEELASVKNGEGKLVDMNEEKFGVYRDNNGDLHIVSAECTHLKCTISWNNAERTWDCPCHGSRFTIDGEVINGPANRNLHAYSEADNMQLKNE